MGERERGRDEACARNTYTLIVNFTVQDKDAVIFQRDCCCFFHKGRKARRGREIKKERKKWAVVKTTGETGESRSATFDGKRKKVLQQRQNDM
jgi:hypothetical protein